MAQKVKCLPAMRETGVRSLDQEDPLKKEMATHSSSLAWKIQWTEEPGGLQSMGWQRVGQDCNFILFLSFTWSIQFRESYKANEELCDLYNMFLYTKYLTFQRFMVN